MAGKKGPSRVEALQGRILQDETAADFLNRDSEFAAVHCYSRQAYRGLDTQVSPSVNCSSLKNQKRPGSPQPQSRKSQKTISSSNLYDEDGHHEFDDCNEYGDDDDYRYDDYD